MHAAESEEKAMFELFFVSNLRAALGDWGSARCSFGLAVLALAALLVAASCGGILQIGLQR